MDAIEFLKETDRMHNFDDQDCAGCEINKRRSDNLSCVNWVLNHPAEAVELIERWAKEHPLKTRQEKFLEIFPRADAHTGVLEICPGDIDMRFACHEPRNCDDCRKNYWFATEEK